MDKIEGTLEEVSAGVDRLIEQNRTLLAENAELRVLVERLADVYAVETDQFELVRLVDDARKLSRAPSVLGPRRPM